MPEYMIDNPAAHGYKLWYVWLGRIGNGRCLKVSSDIEECFEAIRRKEKWDKRDQQEERDDAG